MENNINSDSATVVLRMVLRRLLEKREIKQAELADAVGMPQSTFHDWVNGRSPRDLASLKRVADFFKVDLEYLIFGTKDDREKEAAYRRRLEFENAMLKLEMNKQLNIFETKEEAMSRIQALIDEIDRTFPDVKEEVEGVYV